MASSVAQLFNAINKLGHADPSLSSKIVKIYKRAFPEAFIEQSKTNVAQTIDDLRIKMTHSLDKSPDTNIQPASRFTKVASE